MTKKQIVWEKQGRTKNNWTHQIFSCMDDVALWIAKCILLLLELTRIISGSGSCILHCLILYIYM